MVLRQLTNASTYQEVEAYLYDIPKFTTKNSLDHTRRIVKEMGDPSMDKDMIHIAGTNGKGSVCAFLESLFRKKGLKTGMFTSPHLVSMTERFRINGSSVSDSLFVEAFCEVNKKIVNMKYPTFFEYLFLMAMYIFEKEKVDIVLLETGLGGRLDATNIVTPKVSVITRIGLDHCEYLGDTVEQIAGEKAGIIKEQVPVVFADFDQDVTRVIVEQADRKNAKCYPVSEKDYAVEKSNHKKVDFSYKSSYYKYGSFTLGSSALYQVQNASLALRAYEVFWGGVRDQIDDLKEALASTKWEGRMEEIAPDVYIDGAHNVDGVTAFLETVKAHGHTGKNILMFGVVADKDYADMIRILSESGLFDEVVITGMEDKRAADTGDISREFLKYTLKNPMVFEDVKEALLYSRSIQGEKDRLYIAGSLYLVGYVLPLLKEDSHD